MVVENLIKVVEEKVDKELGSTACELLKDDLSIKLGSNNSTPVEVQITLLNIFISTLLYRYKFKKRDVKVHNCIGSLIYCNSAGGWMGLFEEQIIPFFKEYKVIETVYQLEEK